MFECVIHVLLIYFHRYFLSIYLMWAYSILIFIKIDLKIDLILIYLDLFTSFEFVC